MKTESATETLPDQNQHCAAVGADFRAGFLQPARRRFWVFSDLQQREPDNARLCMHSGVEDFLSLGLHIDAAFYLGDSTEGDNIDHLHEMADMQVEALSRVNAPIWYVMGNHELDFHRFTGEIGRVTVPMRERVMCEPQWHTTASVRDWMLVADFGDIATVMFSDHAAVDGSWFAIHGAASDGKARIDYPDPEASARASKALAALGKPVFTMSHYAYPGGNRASELMGTLLPLPPNVIAHFYGHSHIGDHYWGAENYLRQISGVDNSAITQFDIASLENRRGSAVRSAIVEWFGGTSYAVFFRNHTAHVWEKAFFS